MVDRLEFGIKMPIYNNEYFNKFSAIIYHDIELKDRAQYKFDSVSFLSHDSNLPMGSLSMDGDIIVRQTWPLDVKGGYFNFFYWKCNFYKIILV